MTQQKKVGDKEVVYLRHGPLHGYYDLSKLMEEGAYPNELFIRVFSTNGQEELLGIYTAFRSTEAGTKQYIWEAASGDANS